MTITVLVQGRIRGDVIVKLSRADKPYATFKMTAESTTGISIVSCVTFAKSVIAVVSDLVDGDGIVIGGDCVPTAWIAPDGKMQSGIDVVVHRILTLYQLDKKRNEIHGSSDQRRMNEVLAGNRGT